MDRYIKQAREDITAQLMRSQGSQKINNVQLLLHSNSPRYYSAHPRLSLLILQRYFFSLARARHPLIVSSARYPRSGRICRNCTVTGYRKRYIEPAVARGGDVQKEAVHFIEKTSSAISLCPSFL